QVLGRGDELCAVHQADPVGGPHDGRYIYHERPAPISTLMPRQDKLVKCEEFHARRHGSGRSPGQISKQDRRILLDAVPRAVRQDQPLAHHALAFREERAEAALVLWPGDPLVEQLVVYVAGGGRAPTRAIDGEDLAVELEDSAIRAVQLLLYPDDIALAVG